MKPWNAFQVERQARKEESRTSDLKSDERKAQGSDARVCQVYTCWQVAAQGGEAVQPGIAGAEGRALKSVAREDEGPRDFEPGASS